MRIGRLLISAAALAVLAGGGSRAEGVVQLGDQPPRAGAETSVFVNAVPRPLPEPGQLPVDAKQLAPGLTQGASGKAAGEPRLRPGNEGGAVLKPVQIVPEPVAGARERGLADVTPRAYGEGGEPFSTSRVELNPRRTLISNIYPYRATGRLGFRYQGQNASCSAALIDKGLLLTAAHCVAEFGNGFLPDARWAFIPGYYKGKGAYGSFAARDVFAPASYLDGTANCAPEAVGVVCDNDVAVIVLRPNSRRQQAGSLTGWLGVGFDGWGLAGGEDQLLKFTLVTQLGYPAGLDRAEQMIRNDSAGIALPEGDLPQTLIGSPLDGGSSGGPWISNFGLPPVYNGVTQPAFAAPNMVVGVTSWGYDDGGATAIQGSSPLTSDTLGALIAAACAKHPSACTTQTEPKTP